MNLRTISFWVLYDPKRKLVIDFSKFKHRAKRMDGCVVIRVKGHYLPPKRKPPRRHNDGRGDT